jgi:XTP/dITP diphosphohydrolase
MNLLLGSKNVGKVDEMRAMLAGLPINLRTLSDFPHLEPVKEIGKSYEENAAIKARAYARQSGVWALADDSGLEVKALRGAPGVFSARYAGKGASDSDRVAFLLSQIDREGGRDRTARFVCVTALTDSTDSLLKVASGTCTGQIIDTPRGTNGFGYDPIFVPDGFDQTFGELSADKKNVISHRAKALQAIRAFLKVCLLEREG